MQPLLKAFLKQNPSTYLNPSLLLLCISSIWTLTVSESLAVPWMEETIASERSLAFQFREQSNPKPHTQLIRDWPKQEARFLQSEKRKIAEPLVPETFIPSPLSSAEAKEMDVPRSKPDENFQFSDENLISLFHRDLALSRPLLADNKTERPLVEEETISFPRGDRLESSSIDNTAKPLLKREDVTLPILLATHSLATLPSDRSFFSPDRENSLEFHSVERIPLAQIPEPPEPIEPIEPFEPEEPEEPVEPETPSTPSPIPEPEAGDIKVNAIVIQGGTLFTEEDFSPLIQSYLNRSVSEESLQTLADSITERYLELGYITSRAVLDTNSFASGDIALRILEGSIEKIEVEGVRRLRAAYVRDRVRLGAGAPLNTGKLEDQLRLLRANPLIDNIEASLRTGSTPVQSILIVRVTEANPFRASGSSDNYSPPSVGSERFGLNAGWLNVTGIGDSVSAGYTRTTRGGSDTFNFSYSVPLNAMDGTLTLRTSLNRNNVVQEQFSALDIRGNSALYEISFRQPLVKTPRQEFALSAGFAYQTGQTFTFLGGTPFGFGPEADGTTTTSIFKFGQDYIRRDTAGAWAFRSQVSWGTGLLDATINADPIPDSRFLSWLLQAQRVQVINENNFLIISADLQLSTEPLLSSQQFVVGGGQSVRGYRQNARFGDNGLRFSIEDRITLVRNEAGNPTFIVAPFFDLGWVWNNPDNPNPQPVPEQTFIAGVGVGLIWEAVPGLNIRLDLAYPLMNLSDRQTNAQDDGLYFSVLWNF
ncbi:MAG: ShlB/FhaC/HecB family hemolysin secretion/activation protein [Cyanobacteria bacterium SBLK]|nr:ShlB/FhaC/HecB family hemolysin secretion/activation protein [Cyanobacteria bacterium SBLK]